MALTARDDAAAHKALDAIAAAGFYGSTDNEQLAMRAVSSCETIKAAIATVGGVAGDTATSRATTIQVTGDFHAAALVEALNDAGFSAQVS